MLGSILCMCMFVSGGGVRGKKRTLDFKVSTVPKERNHRQIAIKMVTFRLGLIW